MLGWRDRVVSVTYQSRCRVYLPLCMDYTPVWTSTSDSQFWQKIAPWKLEVMRYVVGLWPWSRIYLSNSQDWYHSRLRLPPPGETPLDGLHLQSHFWKKEKEISAHKLLNAGLEYDGIKDFVSSPKHPVDGEQLGRFETPFLVCDLI